MFTLIAETWRLLTIEGMDGARTIWVRWFLRTILLLILVFIFGLVFNWLGCPKVNIVISLLITFATAIFLTKPEILASVLTAGVVFGVAKEPETIAEETKQMFAGYLKIAGNLLLWESIILFFLGTVSIEENPKAALLIICALVILFLIYELWKIGSPERGRKFVYYYVTIILFASVFSLVPGYVWTNFLGYDISKHFQISETARAVNEADRNIAENEDKKNAATVERIIAKIKKGENLSYVDKKLLEANREKTLSGSIPHKIKEAMSKLSFTYSIDDSYPKPAESPRIAKIEPPETAVEKSATPAAIKTVTRRPSLPKKNKLVAPTPINNNIQSAPIVAANITPPQPYPVAPRRIIVVRAPAPYPYGYTAYPRYRAVRYRAPYPYYR